jgi:redox-sensing transcriptional repressor
VGTSIDIKGEKVPIYHPDDLETYLKEHPSIKIAMLTVPEHSAQDMLDRLVGYGILGVVNFAPKILKLPRGYRNDVQLVNDCIGASLYKIVYQIYQRK